MNSQPLHTVARVVRGVLGMSLTWGLAWIPISLAILPAAFGTWQVWEIDSRGVFAIVMEGFAAGALNGAAFGIALAIADRRRTLHELRPRRVAMYGALAGAAIPAIMLGVANLSGNLATSSVLAIEIVLFAGLGAASAAGSVALARRGIHIEEGDDLEQLSSAAQT